MFDGPTFVVYACWGVFAITWAIASLFVKRTAERSRSMEWLLVTGAGVLAYAMVRNPHWFGTRTLWTPTEASDWLGAGVTVLGLWVTMWARFTLGRNWSAAVTFKQDHELIERGPYRYVRHPIYSGVLLMVLGSAMLRAWISGFVLCGILLVSFWFKLRAEERLLTEHFPEEYPRYRERVRALIPFVL